MSLFFVLAVVIIGLVRSALCNKQNHAENAVIFRFFNTLIAGGREVLLHFPGSTSITQLAPVEKINTTL